MFIEPLATVELNNQWRELQLAEEREVERILLTLSSWVADAAEPVRRTIEAFAALDLGLAKAKYADSIRATMPEMVPFARPRSPIRSATVAGSASPTQISATVTALTAAPSPATAVAIVRLAHFRNGDPSAEA